MKCKTSSHQDDDSETSLLPWSCDCSGVCAAWHSVNLRRCDVSQESFTRRAVWRMCAKKKRAADSQWHHCRPCASSEDAHNIVGILHGVSRNVKFKTLLLVDMVTATCRARLLTLPLAIKDVLYLSRDCHHRPGYGPFWLPPEEALCSAAKANIFLKSVSVMRLWRVHKQSSNCEECSKHALVRICTSTFPSEECFRYSNMRLWQMHKQSSNFEECFKHALVRN